MGGALGGEVGTLGAPFEGLDDGGGALGTPSEGLDGGFGASGFDGSGVGFDGSGVGFDGSGVGLPAGGADPAGLVGTSGAGGGTWTWPSGICDRGVAEARGCVMLAQGVVWAWT